MPLTKKSFIWRSFHNAFKALLFEDDQGRSAEAVVMVGETGEPLGTEDQKIIAMVSGSPSNPVPVGPREAFGNLAVSSPRSLFDSKLDVDDESDTTWTELPTPGTNCSKTYDGDASTCYLRVGDGGNTPDGDRFIRQSRATPYIPGHGKRIFVTGAWGAAEAPANAYGEMRFGNDANGFSFGVDSGGLYVKRWSSVTGSLEVLKVYQENWNIDGFDPAKNPLNPSGVTIDPTKRQIGIFDVQWLGVGLGLLGFDQDGVFWPCHGFKHSNRDTGLPYMSTAVLPISWVVGASGGEVTETFQMNQICCSVQSYGQDPALVQDEFSSNRTTTRNVGTSGLPVVSMRANHERVPIDPVEVGLLNKDTTDQLYWELVLNGTLTGASFTADPSPARHDTDTSATAITGGRVIAEGYVGTSGVNKSATSAATFLSTRSRLGRRVDGSYDIVTLVVYTLSGTADVAGYIHGASYHG